MKPALTKCLNYLRTRLHEDFGDTDAQTVWLDDGGGTWTKIPALQTHSRPSQKDMAGLLKLPTGTVLLFVKKADWPGVKLNDCFFFGAADPGNATIPATATRGEKYIVTAMPAAPQLDWQRVEAERH